MLGEVLQKAGYRTFGSGKWHNGRQAYQRSFTDGAEIFFGGMADHWNVPVYNYDPAGKYDQVCLQVKEPFKSNETNQRHCDHIHAGKHSSELIAEAGIDFINDDKPFFMYLSFLAPHDPRTMPVKYREMYYPAAIELPDNFMGGHPFDNGALHIRDEELAGFPRTPEETRRHLAEYYGMISHLDAQIGKVLVTLEANKLMEDTIIVFAGDNGLAVGQHGLFGKQSCYDHSVRVPLIFSGPGIPSGNTSTAFAYLFDVFPTLCELLEIEVPETVEGTSLVAAMSDSSEKVRDSLYFAYTQYQRAVKKDNYKLIEYVVNQQHGDTQLFDLEKDPREINNLANESAMQAKITELRREMINLRDQWDDCESEWGKKFWKHVDF